jgi:hypothetical protein
MTALRVAPRLGEKSQGGNKSNPNEEGATC